MTDPAQQIVRYAWQPHRRASVTDPPRTADQARPRPCLRSRCGAEAAVFGRRSFPPASRLPMAAELEFRRASVRR